ncbi:MAG TPA: DNRLRE domain-containing protein [Candidatus Limnocylindrales bacterium]
MAHRRRPRRRSHPALVALAAGCLTLASLASLPGARLIGVAAAADPVIATAGDIACDPAASNFNGGQGTATSCRQLAVSNLLVGAGLAAVLPLGDNQYYCGGYQAYATAYDPSWGRVKSITHPVVGNHEYLTSGGTGCTTQNDGAAGYFQYFGSAAGQPGAGYYSFDVGAWHLIALNSNCSDAGGCTSSSAQGRWLASDLAAHPNQCLLAYWHIPLFSSGGRAASNSSAFWQLLYAAHADVVLNGHDHIYERFAPQDPFGQADPAGIREFIVGTGGSNHTSIASIAANSVVRDTSSFGALRLTLHPTGYDWAFQPAVGSFTDSGSASCHVSGGASASASPSPSASSSSTPSPSQSSSPSPTPTASPASSVAPNGQTVALAPAADAYVDASRPTQAFGSSAVLRTDGSPILRSYLRFDLSPVSGTVLKATLRVYANSSLPAGYQVSPEADTTWSESTLTYASAPPAGPVAGSSGPVSAGWTSLDVTSLVDGDGSPVGLVLSSTSGTQLSLASRESANPPQLVVTVQ